jgi:hypothetical protein
VVKDKQEKREPAWVRRESVQEAVRRESFEVEQDTRRKGSAWGGGRRYLRRRRRKMEVKEK